MESKSRNQQASIAKVLATFIHDLTYEDLPETVKEVAKTRISDALSSAYAGRELPHSRTAIEVIKSRQGDCQVFGCAMKASPLDAVLANAVLVGSIIQEDRLATGPPGTMIVPVAFAAGEQAEASGKEILVGIVLGYEVMYRISGATCPLPMSAFRSGPTMGTVGCAATAGRVMKLDVDRLTHTLGYAASLAPGLPNEGWWGGTMEPMFQAGVCAQIGMLSAILAQTGGTAAPQVLEGRHGFLRCWAGTTARASLITEGLGKSFAITRTTVKPYPCCGINQLPVHTARPLAKLGLRARDIVRVVEKISPGVTANAGTDFAGPFANHFQAAMSMQFCVAATILGQPVDSFSFFAEHYDDPEVAELAARVELTSEDGRSKPRFEVYTHEGRVFTAEDDAVDKETFTPSWEKSEKMFMALATASVGERRAGDILNLIMKLDNVNDIRELTEKL